MAFLLDNIIFSLQRGGGVSLHWYEILRRISRDKYKFLAHEYPGAEQNIFRGKMTLEKHQISSGSHLPLAVSRYLPYPVIKGRKSLCLSSYYRVPTDKRQPSVVTVHDFTYEKFRGGLPLLIHSIQKRGAISAADGIVCVSENTKRDLLEYYPGIPEERIRVIYHGVSDAYRPLGQAGRDVLDSRLANIPYVLFVGGRHSYKNFKVAVESVSLLSDFWLVSAGGGAFSQEEQELVDKYIPNRYLHLPSVQDEVLNGLYNFAQAFLYPSAYEGFGLPLLEAMAAGCPVIAANRSSIPEVCGDAAILVDEITPEVIAEQISGLCVSSFRDEIVARGFERVTLFSWEKCYAETLSFYKSIMDKHNIPADFL